MPSPRTAVHIQSIQLAHSLFVRALKDSYTDAQLTHTTGASRTHILWSLGHLVWAYDAALGAGIGLPMVLPARYNDQFAFSTKPSTNVADYPPLSELLARADEGLERACAKIAQLTDEDLAAPLPDAHPLSEFFPSVDLFLSMASIHTGYHVGQVGLLRVAQGMPSLLGA